MTPYVEDAFGKKGMSSMNKRYKVYWERGGGKVVQYFETFNAMHNEMVQQFGRIVVEKFPAEPIKADSEIGASVNLVQSTGSTFGSTALRAIVYVIKAGVEENEDPDIAPQNTGEC